MADIVSLRDKQKPDYWHLYTFYFSDNTKEEVMGKYADYDSDMRYMWVYDTNTLGDGSKREAVRMVNLSEVKHITTAQVERMKDKDGGYVYASVNVEFPSRYASEKESAE